MMTNQKIKRCLILLCTFILPAFLFGQTKVIAHKSHSGNTGTFKIAYETGLFDIDNSNLGMAPEPTVRSASLDSLIFLSDTSAVMVTSQHCSRWERTTKWSAGKDTLYNHFLFSKKNSIAYIKKYLKKNYHFQNPVDSVKFISIETEQQDSTQYQGFPFISLPNDGDNGSLNYNPFVWLLVLALFSILAGGFYYLLNKFQKANGQLRAFE